MQQAAPDNAQLAGRSKVGAPSTARPSRLRVPAYGAGIGAALGVLGGALLLHALGTADGPTAPASDASATPHVSAPGGETLVTGSLPTIYRVDPATCTVLELDRTTNLTNQRQCPADGLALRLDGDEDREDLAVLTVD